MLAALVCICCAGLPVDCSVLALLPVCAAELGMLEVLLEAPCASLGSIIPRFVVCKVS